MRLFSAKVKHLATSLLAVGLVLVATSSPALAYNYKGDNGDVKTHNVTTVATDQRDEPKVCEFYLDGFNFDTKQNVTWYITEGTHGATALSGTLTLDQNGHGVTSNYKLANGMYKLYWNFAGENGSAKHKVFKVDCPAVTPCPKPTPAPTTHPTPKPTPKPCPKPTPTTPTTPTPPVVGRGGGEVLTASTATPAAAPVAATLPNTGVSTATTSLLSLLILAVTAGVATLRPKKISE